ncbi:hypothetical protein FEE95_21250 [Maribacter algarum]|uniref:Uncharacterized protein n=1 Tax=Maribacter algarum (ex Zhang et al. 2020) TaxID=2578118 RepID=A0A5S3PE30_9FLAO|nr:hypothetical protein [Maribacter algarum]TMM52216.1 hypothetical protein FEE95_21250 [Maribacter algarum]
MLVLLVIFTQSCETEIPPEDPTPPALLFRIVGDGFEHNFDQDTDFDNLVLNLNINATYEFTLIGTDAGGVERIQWFNYPIWSVIVNTGIPAGWSETTSHGFEWVGDASNPLTGSIFTGTMSASEMSNGPAMFRFIVSDFGGDGRSPNRILKELNMYIDDHPTRLIEL